MWMRATGGGAALRLSFHQSQRFPRSSFQETHPPGQAPAHTGDGEESEEALGVPLAPEYGVQPVAGRRGDRAGGVGGGRNPPPRGVEGEGSSR